MYFHRGALKCKQAGKEEPRTKKSGELYGYLKTYPIKVFWLHMRHDFSIQCHRNHSETHFEEERCGGIEADIAFY